MSDRERHVSNSSFGSVCETGKTVILIMMKNWRKTRFRVKVCEFSFYHIVLKVFPRHSNGDVKQTAGDTCLRQ